MDFEQYKQLIKPRLSKARYVHSVNVAKEAVKLARRYGADEKKAQTAGILHDIMKDTEPSEQLQIMERSGIILTNLERKAPKLWHAMAGAAFMEQELKISDPDILNAVRYHTTARVGMSLLEKIIYIADYISEERDYDGVDLMREYAYASLAKAMLHGIQFTIGDLMGRPAPVHPDSFSCYNDLILQQTKEM